MGGEKGNCFTVPEQWRTDLFVHRHGLVRMSSLPVGATVHYDVEYSEAKSRYLAVNVVVQAMDQNPQTAPNDESGVAPNPVRGQSSSWWQSAPQETVRTALSVLCLEY